MLLLISLLSACGSTKNEAIVSTNQSDKSMTIKTNDGNGSVTVTGDEQSGNVTFEGDNNGSKVKMNISSGDIPGEFPKDAPLPEGLEYKGAIKTEQDNMLNILMTFEGEGGDFQKIAEQYKGYIKDGGYSDVSTMDMDNLLTISGKKDGGDFSVMATKEEGTSKISVVITSKTPIK